jgi:2'-5' RNA ligase
MSPPPKAPLDQPPEKHLRLFAAVDLGAEVIDRVRHLSAPLHEQAPGARWVSPSGMHLTLFFFGSVSAADVAPLQHALDRAAKDHGPLRLRVHGGGSFGTHAHPRVLWLGLEGDLAPLAALQASVTEHVSALGFDAEHRAF